MQKIPAMNLFPKEFRIMELWFAVCQSMIHPVQSMEEGEFNKKQETVEGHEGTENCNDKSKREYGS